MKTRRIEVKWAVIFCVMQLLWMLIEKLTGLYDEHIDKHHIYTNFIAIPSIAIYVLALLDKRKNFYDGIMSYKQGFVSGLVITLVVTVLSPLVQYVISSLIAPEYFPNIIKYSVEEGKMTQAAAESYFNLKSYIQQVLIGTPIMGIITTAIVALFTIRKNKR
jgi:hypothetical protein